jgi:hypothetical protein
LCVFVRRFKESAARHRKTSSAAASSFADCDQPAPVPGRDGQAFAAASFARPHDWMVAPSQFPSYSGLRYHVCSCSTAMATARWIHNRRRTTLSLHQPGGIRFVDLISTRRSGKGQARRIARHERALASADGYGFSSAAAWGMRLPFHVRLSVYYSSDSFTWGASLPVCCWSMTGHFCLRLPPSAPMLYLALCRHRSAGLGLLKTR